MINSLSWQWSMFILHDQQSFIQWSMLIMHELLWMILFIKPWTMQTVSINSLSLLCSVARRPPASEEGGMVALSQMALLIMYEICWSSNDRLLIMDEICWSCNDAAVDRGWNLFIMVWYAIDHGDDMLIVPMIGVLIMHDVLQNYVTMKVIVITIMCYFFQSIVPQGLKEPGICELTRRRFIFQDLISDLFHRLWSPRAMPSPPSTSDIPGSKPSWPICEIVWISSWTQRISW